MYSFFNVMKGFCPVEREVEMIAPYEAVDSVSLPLDGRVTVWLKQATQPRSGEDKLCNACNRLQRRFYSNQGSLIRKVPLSLFFSFLKVLRSIIAYREVWIP